MIEDMFKKKTLVALLLVVIFWCSSPILVSARTPLINQSQTVLLAQIEKLLAEVVRLQTLLSKQAQTTKLVSNGAYTPYSLVFFPISFETILPVENGKLQSLKSTVPVREVDKQLFELFVSVVGEEAVVKHVREWRVFNKPKADMSAFVELIAGTDDWVVGVNREGFSPTNELTKSSFIDLYLHEYAHILLSNQPEFEERYEKSFWTVADLYQKTSLEQSDSKNKFELMGQYYDENPNRFVSEYATLNSGEDMAETFVSFVTEPKPMGLTIREQKILAFYQEPAMVAIRKTLRENLFRLGY